MKKRMIAMLLAAGLLLGLVVPGIPAASAAELETGNAEEAVVQAEESNIVSGFCGDTMNWELDLDTGVLTISGTGEMYDYWSYWANYRADVKEVIICDGVTSIGAYIFCDHDNLEKVSLPSSLIKIGASAFSGCDKLKAIDIPEGVEVVRHSAFSGCPSLETVSIPGSVKKIQEYTFYDCNSLKEVTLGEGIVSIGDYAFDGVFCTLDKIVIPESVTSIGAEALGNKFYTVIHGYKGSAAEEYAATYGHAFQEIGGEPVIDENLKIMHSLDVQYGFVLNFVVKADQVAEYDEVWMEYRGWIYEDNKVKGYSISQIYPEVKGEYLYFSREDLTTMSMNDEIFVRLFMMKDGKLYISEIDTYSIAQYAYSQLNNPGAGAELKTICANMLRYGSAMQTYKGYRTDALADSAMTQEHKAYLTDLNNVHFNNNYELLDDVENPSVTWVGKTLNLMGYIGLRLVAEVDEGVNVDDLYLQVVYQDKDGNTQCETVEEKEAYGTKANQYAFDIWYLGTTGVRTVLQMAIFSGDTQVSPTMYYSIDSYGANATGALSDLCKAMLAYSDSVCEFLN